MLEQVLGPGVEAGLLVVQEGGVHGGGGSQLALGPVGLETQTAGLGCTHFFAVLSPTLPLAQRLCQVWCP